MRILEKKGYLKRKKLGRAHIYAPAVEKKEVQKKAIHFILSRFFDNSPKVLVQNLLSSEHLDNEDLKQIKSLIGKNESQNERKK